MKLYGHPLSSCTRKVLITLAEKGLAAELRTVDLFAGEHRAAPHLARHPFGVVPVLDDDGFVLYESRAIIRYLDARSGTPSLVPASSRDAARMDQWLSVDQSYVAPNTRMLAVERVLKKHEGLPPDRAAERTALGALAAAFATIDRGLGGEWLAGPAFSLADASLMPYVGSLPLLDAEELLAELPRLSAWWARARERDSWRRALAPDAPDRIAAAPAPAC